MIVREEENCFVMIEQHHHGHVARDIMTYLKPAAIRGIHLKESVMYAIQNHDIGWQNFDAHPFWNDKSHAPYSFIDFPLSPKIVLYQHGIHVVEKVDPYAALLCSEHYTRFLCHHHTEEIQSFLEAEKERRSNLIKKLPEFREDLFQFHYGLLQLADNLSLYVCLNQPGVTKEKEHPFFKKGIPVSSALDDFPHVLEAIWLDQSTIGIQAFPFTQPFSILLKQKVLAKEVIKENGLVETYIHQPAEHKRIHFVPVT